MEKIQPRTLSGFMELLPGPQQQMERIMQTLRQIYSRYGFTPLDTPIIFSQMVPTLKKLRFTMSDLFSKMPQHTTFIFAEALQKSQPVPWGAEQKFRVCQHRKFPRHAAAAEKQ